MGLKDVLKNGKALTDSLVNSAKNKEFAPMLQEEEKCYKLAYMSFKIYHKHLCSNILSDEEEEINLRKQNAYNEFMNYYNSIQWSGFYEIYQNAVNLMNGCKTSWLPIGAQEWVTYINDDNAEDMSVNDFAKTCNHKLLEYYDPKLKYVPISKIIYKYTNYRDYLNDSLYVFEDNEEFLPICLKCGHLRMFWYEHCPCCGEEFDNDYNTPYTKKRIGFEHAVTYYAYYTFMVNNKYRNTYMENKDRFSISENADFMTQEKIEKLEDKYVDNLLEQAREEIEAGENEIIKYSNANAGIDDLKGVFYALAYNKASGWEAIGYKEYIELNDGEDLIEAVKRVNHTFFDDLKLTYEEREELVSEKLIGLNNFENYLNEVEKYDFEKDDSFFIPVCLHCGQLRTWYGDKCPNCNKEYHDKLSDEEREKLSKQKTDNGFCTSCGTPITEGAKFCAKCGKQIVYEAQSFCTGCGTKLTEGMSFCPKCGKQI